MATDSAAYDDARPTDVLDGTNTRERCVGEIKKTPTGGDWSGFYQKGRDAELVAQFDRMRIVVAKT